MKTCFTNPPFPTSTAMIFLYTLRLLLSIILWSTSTALADPLPAKQTAFARVGQHLYVQGGLVWLENKFTSTSQFFTLDLGTSWDITSPRWKTSSCDNSYTPSIGLHTQVNSTDMFTTLYQTTSGGYFISNYDTETGSWLSDATVPVQESMNQFAPPIAVPHNDLVYITDSTKMNILSMNNRNVRSLDIPPNTLNVNSLRGGGVHSGDSILYFGGQSAPGGKPQEVVTAFNLVSESWNNLSTTGDIPPPLVDPCIAADDSGNTIVLFGGTLLNGTVPTNASRAIYILDRVSLMWRQGPLAPSPRTQMACTAVGTQFVAWGGSDGQGIVPGPPIIYDLSKNQWVSSYIAHDKEEDSMQQKIIVIGAAAGGLMVITMALVEYIYQFRKKERDQERSKLEQQVQDRMISEGDRVNREKSTTTRRMSDSGSDLEYGMEEYYRPEEIIPFPGCYYLGNSKDSIERSPHTSIDCILIPARNPPIQPSSNARNPHGRPKTPTSTPLTSTNQVIPQRGIYALGIACQPRPVM